MTRNEGTEEDEYRGRGRRERRAQWSSHRKRRYCISLYKEKQSQDRVSSIPVIQSKSIGLYGYIPHKTSFPSREGLRRQPWSTLKRGGVMYVVYIYIYIIHVCVWVRIPLTPGLSTVERTPTNWPITVLVLFLNLRIEEKFTSNGDLCDGRLASS